jgi:hypothetical protein
MKKDDFIYQFNIVVIMVALVISLITIISLIVG